MPPSVREAILAHVTGAAAAAAAANSQVHKLSSMLLNVNVCLFVCAFITCIGDHTVGLSGSKFDIGAALDLEKVKMIVAGPNGPYRGGPQYGT